MELTSKTAVITGGASGMGQATAERFLARGAQVAILDRDASGRRALLERWGPSVAVYEVDVTDEAKVEAAISDVSAHFGDVHICANFAGVAVMKRTVGDRGPMPLDVFMRPIEVNLVGTFNVARLCAARMSRNAVLDEDGSRGVVINVASIAAYQGPAGTVGYSASKAAVVGMTLPLARDLAPYGIRVNTICPGLVLTAMTYGSDPGRRETAEARASQSLQHVLFPRRFGAADEVARLAEHLVENDYINAECIRIDGGKRV